MSGHIISFLDKIWHLLTTKCCWWLDTPALFKVKLLSVLDKSWHLLTTKWYCCLNKSALFKVVLLSRHLLASKWYCCLGICLQQSLETSALFKLMLVSGHLLATDRNWCLDWTKIDTCSLQSVVGVWTHLLCSKWCWCLDICLLQIENNVWTGQKSTSAHYKVLLVSGHICSVQSDAGVWTSACYWLKLVLQGDFGVWTSHLSGQKWTSSHYICSVQSDAGVWTGNVAKSLDEAEASATGIGLPARPRMCPTRLLFLPFCFLFSWHFQLQISIV